MSAELLKHATLEDLLKWIAEARSSLDRERQSLMNCNHQGPLERAERELHHGVMVEKYSARILELEHEIQLRTQPEIEVV